ncbi:MAG: response regulator [Deltaproteobacteria bacterium]|nr:response regulator [Deltaproteobacteria bacterium]
MAITRKKRLNMDPFETLKTKKTLLVDDDGLIRDSLDLAFTSRGCTIRTVESAEEGMEALKREHFDIIVSDYTLSGMNGMEFLKATDAFRPGSVRVLISGNVQANELEDKGNLGIHEFVEKPFTVLDLAGTLAGLIATVKKVDR